MSRKYEDIFPDEWYDHNPDIDKNFDEMLSKPRKKRAYCPRGFVEDDNKFCHPDKNLLTEFVKLLIDFRIHSSRSLRETQDMILAIEKENGIEDPKVISLGGVTLLFDRLEKELGVHTKDTQRVRLEKVRKERIKKAKESGQPRLYNYSTKVREKVEAQKRLTQANKELKDLEKERKRLQRQAARSARKLKLKDDPTKYVESLDNPAELRYEIEESPVKAPEIVIPSTNLIQTYMDSLSKGVDERVLMEMYREITDKKEKFDKRQVAFLPTPRQYRFLSASEDIVLYGGAAGGGKSYAMVIDALRHVDQSDYKAVIIRKTTPELRELIDNSRELYPIAVPGAKFNGTNNVWRFPSGAQIEFGFLDKPADKFKYQGIQYGYVGFDELSQHATDEGFSYLRSRLRTTNPKVNPYMRATANPGSQWVYELFIKDREPDVPFILPGTEKSIKPISCRFIPAKLEDNPHLDKDGMYRALLESLPEVERKQLLEGDWLASNDAMFPEFNILEHVVEPFIVPRHWNRVAGLDYGYRDPSAAVWFAVNPDDGSIVIYDEFLQAGLTGREFAQEITRREQNELVSVDHPIDWSVFARTGHTGPTIAEHMLSVPGMRLRRADKNREAGWMQVHELLRRDPATGYPKLQIFSTCKNLIRQLNSAKIKENKPDELNDTRNSDGHWDLLDALRYGVMARPRLKTFDDSLTKVKQVNRWQQVNEYFSI